MSKLVKVIIILLTFVLISLLAFYNVFTLFSNVNDRLKKAELILSPYRSYLFQKINLNYQQQEIDFSDVDNRLHASFKNYIGYEVMLAQDVLFATPSIKPFATKSWKRSKVTTQSLINRSGHYAQLIFTNNNTGHQFKVIIKLIDQNFLLNLLIINASAISIYLFILIILILSLFFYNKKQPDTSGLDSPASQKGDFIFSDSGYKKYQSDLNKAIQLQKPFSVGLIKSFKHSFNESLNPKGFALIQDHIKSNHGLLEWNEHHLMLVLPNTHLKEAIQLVERFFARYIEENIDIELNGGISTLNDRNVSSSLLTKEAFEALKRARKKSVNYLLGFDADPLQYKLYLKKKKEN